MSTSNARRRNKPTLSCSFCRTRKLRCDRQQPCNACVRRGRSSECVFSSSEQERRDAVDYRPTHARRHDAIERVARLENLVTELRDKLHNESDRDRSAPNEVAQNMGSLNLSDDHIRYTGTTHWNTILDDIGSLKSELHDEPSECTAGSEQTSLDDDYSTNASNARITLLDAGSYLSEEQIRSMIPPRAVVDDLVSHFFKSFSFADFILSRSTFFSECSKLWENPCKTSVAWLGLLFSVMAMSVFTRQVSGGVWVPSESSESLEDFRALTIYCLLASKYLRPGKYTVQTLLLHFTLDQSINLDTSEDDNVLIGVIIRLAFRMGLHRDPSHWTRIEEEEAERRRRIWMILYHLDFYTSTQVGLPRIIKDSQCDVYCPPPSEVASQTIQAHPLFFFRQRDQIIKVAAEIYDISEQGPTSPAQLSTLQTRLDHVMAIIPSWLRWQTPEAALDLEPSLVLESVYLDVLGHKAAYLLHRRSFLNPSKDETSQKRQKSHDLCVDAALAILAHQRRLREATQPGGTMYSIRWKVSSSLNNEFLQATMMLCFTLSSRSKGQQTGARDIDGDDRETEIVQVLQTAKDLWSSIAGVSSEARRAIEAIQAVVKEDPTAPRSLTGGDWSEIDYGVFGMELDHSLYLSEFDFNYSGQSMFDNSSFTAAGNDMVFPDMPRNDTI